MRRDFNFVNKFEGNLEAKLWKYIRDFQSDKSIKKKNDRMETWIRMNEREFRQLKFVQTFIRDRRVEASRKNKVF